MSRQPTIRELVVALADEYIARKKIDTNTEALVYRAMVYGQLKDLAEEHYKSLLDTLKTALFKEDIEAVEVGAPVTLYTGDHSSFILQLRKGKTTTNTADFVSALRQLGVSNKIIEEAKTAATKQSEPSKYFTFAEVKK